MEEKKINHVQLLELDLLSVFCFLNSQSQKHSCQKPLKPAYVLLFKKQFCKYDDVVLHKRSMKEKLQLGFFPISFQQNSFS